ncbi:hypothetical protein MNBD_ALPHA07-2367 [hydrothermal vent metagenome]|uniref:Uncharacterized protein n=1 Tax=hydrothermal vent metagenome TaxID=652676 RepID=A0A3B0SMW8_9ZZZZ
MKLADFVSKVPIRQVLRLDQGKLVVFETGKLREQNPKNTFYEANVSLFDEKDELIWTVNGMDQCPHWNKQGPDCFESAFLPEDCLYLISFWSLRFNLDVETGFATYHSFMK